MCCPFYVFLWLRKIRITKQTSDITYLRLKKRESLIISLLLYKYNNHIVVDGTMVVEYKGDCSNQ